MAQEILNDGELQGVHRQKINDNFTELFDQHPDPQGLTGSFLDQGGNTITVTNGLITGFS